MSWSPNPILQQRSAAQGLSVRNESGPASIRQPSTRSVTSTPPRRGLDSNKTYWTGVPDWRFFSIVYAAERPETPPPTMAMRFTVLGLRPVARSNSVLAVSSVEPLCRDGVCLVSALGHVLNAQCIHAAAYYFFQG